MQVDFDYLDSLSVEPVLHPTTGVPLKPRWLKVDKVHGDRLYNIKRNLRADTLHTVCEEARCPNISECWNAGTATFMVLGDTCTRGCRFCAVKTGDPKGVVDDDEPDHVAGQIASMGLDYAVITMVDRDDLPDGGAAHVARVIKAIHSKSPRTLVEVLAGDFSANAECLSVVIEAGRGLEVFAHNVETVERLTPRVRDARAGYRKSLLTLETSRVLRPQTLTKSAIMLGLGEDALEIAQTLQDLRSVGVDIVTIGQYLQPTRRHLRIKRFVHPLEFDYWKSYAESIGFKAIASGPLVRSSYKAAHLFPGSGPSEGRARA
jgi:lipoic acid synthetase